MFLKDKAWEEVALPAFNALSNNIMALLDEVDISACDLALSPLGEINTADTPKLKRKFEETDSLELAYGSFIIYHYGMWGDKRCFHENGCYWKFSKICDKTLRDRCDIVEPYGSVIGLTYKVKTGMIALKACTPIMSTKTILVAPATIALEKEVRKDYSKDNLFHMEDGNSVSWFHWWKSLKERNEALRTKYRPFYGPLRDFYDLSKYNQGDMR